MLIGRNPSQVQVRRRRPHASPRASGAAIGRMSVPCIVRSLRNSLGRLGLIVRAAGGPQPGGRDQPESSFTFTPGTLRTSGYAKASDHKSSTGLRETTTKTEMYMDDPVCELHEDGDDVFVLVDGMKIARRGRPDTAQAMTWVMLEPGWTVRDVQSGTAIEVRYEGAHIH